MLKTKYKSKKMLLSHILYIWDFYFNFVERKLLCFGFTHFFFCHLGYTKTQNPGIETVLHWQPPDLHIQSIPSSVVSTYKTLNTIYHYKMEGSAPVVIVKYRWIILNNSK